MKKFNLLLVVILALWLIVPVSAQFYMGITGGLNLANVSEDPKPEFEYSNRTALGFGGVLDIFFTENVGLHLVPMYLQKGAKIDASTPEVTLKLAYIEIPALIKIAFGSSSTRPYIIAGPTVGFLLSAKATSNEAKVDIKDNLKNIDFGLGAGAGMSFPVGKTSIFIEGRYILSLANINDDPENPDTKVKNKGILIIAGITFPLGKQ